jgi:hypothetical protein
VEGEKKEMGEGCWEREKLRLEDDLRRRKHTLSYRQVSPFTFCLLGSISASFRDF